MRSISQVEREAVDNSTLLPERMGEKMNGKKTKYICRLGGRNLNEVSSDGFNLPLLINQESYTEGEPWKLKERGECLKCPLWRNI